MTARPVHAEGCGLAEFLQHLLAERGQIGGLAAGNETAIHDDCLTGPDRCQRPQDWAIKTEGLRLAGERFDWRVF